MENMDGLDELLRLAKNYIDFADENAQNNPTSDSIQIVIVEQMKKPYKKTIPNTLKASQEIVGGYMENYFIGKTNKGARVAVVCNEDGQRLRLPYNRNIIGFSVILGTFFITAYNYQGDNVSLTDEQADKYIKQFSSTEVNL